MTDDARHLLVVAPTGRADSLEAGVHVCLRLIAAGITPVSRVQHMNSFSFSVQRARRSNAVQTNTVIGRHTNIIISTITTPTSQ